MALSKEIIIECARLKAPDLEIYEHRDQLTLIVKKEEIPLLCEELKTNSATQFDMLTDVTAIDWAKRENRFEVVWFLYSNTNKARVRLKAGVDESDCTAPSVTSIWESANWYERETYDMFGIKFEGHPNLRRFYMPEDMCHPETGEPLYPLRKDFPMMGVPDSMPLPPYPEKYGELE